ncbi:hypothetical protein Thimo_0262 [Thioflavicoccus mobilis 8321]|uniref:Flagellar protein FliT n=1 Tax=Thioflavicoccus mobilis 8321 TaxID=765912 RepID=L0GQW3_9GAMM|nr:flagellar protein FliT [Thioflavicoccus mobilis]AGA89133.1 hypothetical protein Thimo_0262 [Thioflavicoccus mobilis 8321]
MRRLAVVDPSRPREWDDILENTRALLAAAMSGDWGRAMQLERERHARIDHFFATAPALHEAAWVRRGIEEILVSDARLSELCQREKARAGAEVIDLRHKAAASRAYAKATAA